MYWHGISGGRGTPQQAFHRKWFATVHLIYAKGVQIRPLGIPRDDINEKIAPSTILMPLHTRLESLQEIGWIASFVYSSSVIDFS